MPDPRISAISFLNTAPLMWDFEHTEVGQDFQIDYTVPSRCVQALESGEADLGLIPVVAYLRIPQLAVIPDISISTPGAVRSILLVSKLPLERVETIAADNGSETSVVLCRLLLKKWLCRGRPEPSVQPQAPQLDSMLERADAALIIGDSALRVSTDRDLVFDLGREWRRLTGLPFVFAFWAVRASKASPDLSEIFVRSRDHGLEPRNLEHTARLWAPRVGISEREVRSYLTENIAFDLNAEKLHALELFWRYGWEEHLLPAPVPIQFIEPTAASQSAARKPHPSAGKLAG